MEESNFDPAAESLIRRLVYPVQYDRNPSASAKSIVDDMCHSGFKPASREKYIEAVRAVLVGTTEIANLIPQPHPEQVVRSYLLEVLKELEVDQPHTKSH
jgi:hypothetical protein